MIGTKRTKVSERTKDWKEKIKAVNVAGKGSSWSGALGV